MRTRKRSSKTHFLPGGLVAHEFDVGSPPDEITIESGEADSKCPDTRALCLDHAYLVLSAKMDESLKKMWYWVSAGGVWLVFGLVSLRIPGELDNILLWGGVMVILYSLLRHGLSALSWYDKRTEWLRKSSTIRASRLHSRLEEALGKWVSEQQLPDTSDYEAMVNDGTTTMEELSALAACIEKGFFSANDKSASDIARESGLHVNTIIFYRELVTSVRELKLIMPLK